MTESAPATADPGLVTSMLTKLGVEAADKLTPERANKKLKNRLATGIPTDVSFTPEELATANTLGCVTTVATPVPVTPRAPKTAKPAKPPAAPKASFSPKPVKAKPVKAKPVKAPAAPGAPRERKGAAALFIAAWKTRKTWDRKELTDKIIADSGNTIKHYSVGNYIALAKKPGNGYGFVLTEEVKKDGSNTLRIVTP